MCRIRKKLEKHNFSHCWEIIWFLKVCHKGQISNDSNRFKKNWKDHNSVQKNVMIKFGVFLTVF